MSSWQEPILETAAALHKSSSCQLDIYKREIAQGWGKWRFWAHGGDAQSPQKERSHTHETFLRSGARGEPRPVHNHIYHEFVSGRWAFMAVISFFWQSYANCSQYFIKLFWRFRKIGSSQNSLIRLLERRNCQFRKVPDRLVERVLVGRVATPHQDKI